MLIDFEQRFREYLENYEQENELDEQQLEELTPELYLEWLEMPQKWLNGKSPVSYYADLSAAELVEDLGKYILSDITLPGVLLNRIADDKQETYPYLISLLQNYEDKKAQAVKVAIVRLIEEMDLPHPYEYYIEVITRSNEQNDYAEACADELKNSGQNHKEEIIAAFEAADNAYASDCLLDVLSYFKYDARIFQFVLEKFLYSGMNQAFYASCLGKMGNEKALPFLEEALRSDDVGYYDYIAIKNALEALGGEIDIERDFSGDKDYESLKNLGE